jgi:transcription antitermination factor NusG
MQQTDISVHENAANCTVASPPECALSELSYPRWYAVGTRPRHEKAVARLLQAKSVEAFLPVCKSVHRWNDRNAVVSQPIFPGYVFVRIGLEDRMQVLSVPGVVNFVGPHGRPASIPEEELIALRRCLDRHVSMEPHPYLAVGSRVRIKQGLLAEMEGILIRKKGQFRLVLSVHLIARSVAVEVDGSVVAPVGRQARLIPEHSPLG